MTGGSARFMSREIHAQNPEFGPVGRPASELPEDVRNRLQQAIRQMRADTASFYARETVRELRELVEDISKGNVASRGRWRGNLAAAAV